MVALWNRHNFTRNPRLLERIIKNNFISFLHFKYTIPETIPIPSTTVVMIFIFRDERWLHLEQKSINVLQHRILQKKILLR